MTLTRDQVQDYIQGKLEELAQDWDPPRAVTPDSLLFTQLGFESLDAVILGVSIQEHYGRQMPFAELFAELGASQRDLSISQLVDFVYGHATGTAAEVRKADSVS